MSDLLREEAQSRDLSTVRWPKEYFSVVFEVGDAPK